MSKRKVGSKPPTTTAPSPPPPDTDPIDVITQHWSDLSGLTRKEITAKLVMIGHCHLKANRAGVTDTQRELEQVIAEKEHNDEQAKGVA